MNDLNVNDLNPLVYVTAQMAGDNECTTYWIVPSNGTEPYQTKRKWYGRRTPLERVVVFRHATNHGFVLTPAQWHALSHQARLNAFLHAVATDASTQVEAILEELL